MLDYLAHFRLVEPAQIGSLLLRRRRLVGLGVCVFILSAHPMLTGEGIVSFTSSNGRLVFSNIEEAYRFVTPPLPPVESGLASVSPERDQPPPRIIALIDQIAGKHGVDPELVKAVAKVESDYNPRAVSSRGAQGVMQLVPSTANRFGVTNAFDPKQNIEGGVRYLKLLQDMFSNNLPWVLAAYNAGEHAVRKYHGIPPYRETQNYVRKITQLYGEHPPESATKGLKADIVTYRDTAGRTVYSNVESALQ